MLLYDAITNEKVTRWSYQQKRGHCCELAKPVLWWTNVQANKHQIQLNQGTLFSPIPRQILNDYRLTLSKPPNHPSHKISNCFTP